MVYRILSRKLHNMSLIHSHPECIIALPRIAMIHFGELKYKSYPYINNIRKTHPSNSYKFNT